MPVQLCTTRRAHDNSDLASIDGLLCASTDRSYPISIAHELEDSGDSPGAGGPHLASADACGEVHARGCTSSSSAGRPACTEARLSGWPAVPTGFGRLPSGGSLHTSWWWLPSLAGLGLAHGAGLSLRQPPHRLGVQLVAREQVLVVLFESSDSRSSAVVGTVIETCDMPAGVLGPMSIGRSVAASPSRSCPPACCCRLR